MQWLMAGVAGVAVGTGYLLFAMFKGGTAAASGAALEREFASALDRMLAAARKRGEGFLEVNAADLHRQVGGYPGPQHHMTMCCDALRGAMGPDDFVVREPRSGYGPSLTLRYHLDDAAS